MKRQSGPTPYNLLRLSCGHTACVFTKPRPYFFCHACSSFKRVERVEPRQRGRVA